MKPRRQVLLIIETAKAYGRGLLAGIGNYIAERTTDWSIYLEERGLEDRLPTWMAQWRGDGVILRGGTPASGRTLSRLGIPVVETSPDISRFGFPLVYCDDAQIVAQAVEHFLDRGVRRLNYCQLSGRPWSNLRLAALHQEIQGRGMELGCYTLPPSLEGASWPARRTHLKKWLNELPKPAGILAENDVCGLRILDTCRDAGIRIPEDLAVLGIDNDAVLCQLGCPTLSSVDLNVAGIGYQAALLLDRLMDGKPAPRKPMLVRPQGVVARHSTDVLAIEDPVVVEALSLIRTQACAGLEVEKLLAQLSVSRRGLERRFQKALGRAPKEEMLRVRVARAAQLLTRTSLAIGEIAHQCGFEDVAYFSRLFRARLGISPRRYRLSIPQNQPDVP